MATITPIKGKQGTKYRVRIRRHGHGQVSATFKRKTDAEKFAREKDNEHEIRKYFDKKKTKKHTVANAIDRYINDGILDSLRTSDIRKHHLSWFREHIGNYNLTEVSPAVLAECRDALRKKKTRYDTTITNASINRYFSSLSNVCKYAVVDWFWLESNPCKLLPRLKEETKHGRALTRAEYKLLSDYCLAHPEENLSIVIMLALCSGMRLSEIRFLTWEEVDLKREQISLHADRNKNKSPKVVPLVDPALALLKNHAKVRRIDCDWVFPGKFVSYTKNPFRIDEVFRKLMAQLKIDNFRFHDLRHTCASYLAEAGVNTVTIAEILGHKTLEMAKRYAHLSVEHKRDVLKATNAKLQAES